MRVPQRLSFVTLGTRDMRRARAFYGAWGWQEREGGDDQFAQYGMGGVRLALYPLHLLGQEAAPGMSPPPVGWNGVTLAINVEQREGVDAAFRAALAAGARAVAEPVARDWGGYSAYVADPEAQRWEIAWAPDFDVTA